MTLREFDKYANYLDISTDNFKTALLKCADAIKTVMRDKNKYLDYLVDCILSNDLAEDCVL